MGYLRATDMITFAGFDAALTDHLQYNHYPPVSTVFLPAAKQAIDLAADGDYDSDIELPNGKVLTVAEIVQQLHLDPFVSARLNDEGEV